MGWLGKLVVVTLALVPTLAVAHPRPPRLTARAAVVMDARTGRVLWARNPDLKLPPASTTKVMTALLALESGRLGNVFTASRSVSRVEPTKLHLRPGQKLRLEDLVYATLLNSANDAAVVIAEGLAGSVPRFAARMNKRARDLGAKNTHFLNPHGLPQTGHYSTARDLAKIFRQALRKSAFRRILKSDRKIVRIVGSKRAIQLKSHNRLLHSPDTPAIGKTGYTRRAKRCFVGAGRHGDAEVIIVVLGATDLWADAKSLLRFGFASLSAGAKGASASAAKSDRPQTEEGGGALERPPTYGITLSTAMEIERAKRLQHAVRRRGFDSFVEEVKSGGERGRYQVLVGYFSTRAQAEKALRKLRAEIPLPAKVVMARQ